MVFEIHCLAEFSIVINADICFLPFFLGLVEYKEHTCFTLPVVISGGRVMTAADHSPHCLSSSSQAADPDLDRLVCFCCLLGINHELQLSMCLNYGQSNHLSFNCESTCIITAVINKTVFLWTVTVSSYNFFCQTCEAGHFKRGTKAPTRQEPIMFIQNLESVSEQCDMRFVSCGGKKRQQQQKQLAVLLQNVFFFFLRAPSSKCYGERSSAAQEMKEVDHARCSWLAEWETKQACG